MKILREVRDYIKFSGIKNKGIVFYSENEGSGDKRKLGIAITSIKIENPQQDLKDAAAGGVVESLQ